MKCSLKMMTMAVLLTVTTLSVAAGQDDWRRQIRKATYTCDKSNPVVLEDGTEALSEEALALLENELLGMVDFTNDAPTTASISAARVLGKYRKAFKQQRQEMPAAWDAGHIEFYLTYTDENGTHAILGANGTSLTPGTPFETGTLLGFSGTRYWFEDLTGNVTIHDMTLPKRSGDATQAFLAANAQKETEVYGLLAEQLGYTTIFFGNRQPLSGTFEGDSLRALFTNLFNEKGYAVVQKGTTFQIYDSEETRDAMVGTKVLGATVDNNMGAVELQDVADMALGLYKTAKDTMDELVSEHGGVTEFVKYYQDIDENTRNQYTKILDDLGGKMAESSETADSYAVTIVDYTLELAPAAAAGDEGLQNMLWKMLHWFDYDSFTQKKAAYANIYEGLVKASDLPGAKGERAARLAELLASEM